MEGADYVNGAPLLKYHVLPGCYDRLTPETSEMPLRGSWGAWVWVLACTAGVTTLWLPL